MISLVKATYHSLLRPMLCHFEHPNQKSELPVFLGLGFLIFCYCSAWKFRCQHHIWWRLPVRKVGAGDRMRIAVFLT